jgi:hypothetical protein
VQQLDFSHHSEPPDLLRRFVPTPFKAMHSVVDVQILVQTNDITLLPASPLEPNLATPQEKTFEWKLVRDADVRDQLESPVTLNCNSLTVVHMGPACLLALDQEQQELLGFIGAGIDTRTYREFLVPFMQRMTEKAFSRHQPLDMVHRNVGSIYD